MGFNCFRSDDLESLGYSLMDLIDKEKVPWAHITDKVKIKDAKSEFKDKPADPLFKGIQTFIWRCQALRFDQEPDYEALKKDI